MKGSNEIKSLVNLEPYSNLFKDRNICWFPVYIQIGENNNFNDYLVLENISSDFHYATYYKISGEYSITLQYNGFIYTRNSFKDYQSYITCSILPCTAKEVLAHNPMCKLEDTAIMLKKIYEDVKKEDSTAMFQNIWVEHGYYYHIEQYMKNKYIYFDF